MASSMHTPRQLQRPSYGGSPGTNFSASTAARKASLRQLTGQGDPKTPASAMGGGGDLEVGDAVNVPGDMFGTVKFVGSVKGKAGRFVGVELDAQFASRGKNDGDVDGIHYFHTTVSGAGIFLPIHRAEKRSSPSASIDSFPGTPDTPTYSTVNGTRTTDSKVTPALPHKFAQSVGPGVRPSSPNFKPKRPSLPRPESPFRKPAPPLAPTPGKALSQSVRGVTPGRTPSKPNFRASTTTRGPPTAGRSPSRNSSRLGTHEEVGTPVGIATTSNGRTISQGSIPSFSQPLRTPSRLGSAGGQEQEIQRLRTQLSERDRRLEEQAASLADMEQSVKELSAFLPDDASPGTRRGTMSNDEDQSAAQLRQLLREKNEKISMLTAEFDAHRADFRSTLDSLEMASTETERVYEEQKRDLLARIGELEEVSQSKEDFEGVAQQLKQLEDLVAELEEGLEESRRGEAEARGEVEFLRGEVERGRSELKREREKAASVMKTGGEGVNFQQEMDQKDNEIRGLKAIVHSLSSNPNATTADAKGLVQDSEQVQKLQTALEDSQKEKEELEQELEQLRRDSAMSNGTTAHIRNESERTATAPETGKTSRPRGDTIKATSATHSRHPSKPNVEPLPNGTSTTTGTSNLYCEMCESDQHDTLECTKFTSASAASKTNGVHSNRNSAEKTVNFEAVPYSPGKENEGSGKSKAVQEDKWCALCEKDGHLAFDCPEEQY